ncbi:hypothetical protein CB1_000082007, partial [Camelus ferus]
MTFLEAAQVACLQEQRFHCPLTQKVCGEKSLSAYLTGSLGAFGYCLATNAKQHFSELLDEFSQNVLGQLLNDPFLSEKSVSMEVEPSPTSPAPLIQAEHSYSLCEEPRAQSPFTHVTTNDSFNDDEVESEKWYLSTDFPSTTIKTEPITDEPPSGLVPSVTLTITAISTPFEKEEPPLEMNTGVDSSCQTVIPKIKLEPHEVDQFLNFSPKE